MTASSVDDVGLARPEGLEPECGAKRPLRRRKVGHVCPLPAMFYLCSDRAASLPSVPDMPAFLAR